MDIEQMPDQQAGRIAGARRILANVGWRALSDIGSKAITLVLYAAIARELGAKGFGVFAFALAFVTLVTTLANFGQDGILTREVARDRGLLTRYFANTLVLKLALALPALALALAVAWSIGMSAETRWTIVFLGLAVVVESLTQTCFAAYQAFERLSLMPVVVITQRIATTIPAIVAMMAGAGVVAVAAIYAAGTLVSIVLALLLLYARIARPGFEIDVRSWWPLMRVAAPLGIAGVFIIVLQRVDTAMLAFYDSDAVVGNYSAAYRLFEATLIVGWSVTAAVYPVFSRLTRNSEPPLALVFERALKLVVAPTLPLAIGAVVLGGSLVELVYGTGFDDAASALAWLAPAIVLYPVAQISASLLVGRDRQRTVALVYGLVALENVLANLVLIPAFSLQGAAAGTSLSQALITVPFFALALKTTGRIDVLRVLAAPVLAALVSGVAMVALRGSFGLAVAAGAVLFIGALVFFERRFYPGDAAAMIAILRRREAV